jgi:hypothetical protein
MATMDEFSLLGRQAPQCSQSTLLCRSIERFRSSSDFLTLSGIITPRGISDGEIKFLQNHLVEVIVITRLSHCMDVDFEWKLPNN